MDTIVMQDIFKLLTKSLLCQFSGSLSLGLYRTFISIMHILCTVVMLFINIYGQVFAVIQIQNCSDLEVSNFWRWANM